MSNKKVLFANITIIDEDFEVKENYFVGTKDDTIEVISSTKPEGEYDRIIDGKGKLLMTGFVNAHAHSPMTLLRGYGENLPLDRWLFEKIFPFEDKLTEEGVYWATLLGMAESLRYGIVSSTDNYYFCDAMVRAIVDSKTKSNISRCVSVFSDDSLWDLPQGKEIKPLFEKYHGYNEGKIKIEVSLHSEYTTTEKSAIELSEYAKSVNANMHVHVSETKKEHEECKERHGRTPVRFLADCGAFDTRSTAAHCVWLEDEDMDILKEKGVTVACNPISNLKLASGVCNVPKLFEKGVNVAIGTDSVASNNSLNFIEEMKMFALAPKMMYNAPWAISPKETLKAATICGATAQGRDNCGKLKEGNKADLVMIDIDTPWMHPVHNIMNNLVYSASGSDVLLTMVDGEILYENGEYYSMDIDKVVWEVENHKQDMLDRL